jgi:hypothetical protein
MERSLIFAIYLFYAGDSWAAVMSSAAAATAAAMRSTSEHTVTRAPS